MDLSWGKRVWCTRPSTPAQVMKRCDSFPKEDDRAARLAAKRGTQRSAGTHPLPSPSRPSAAPSARPARAHTRTHTRARMRARTYAPIDPAHPHPRSGRWDGGVSLSLSLSLSLPLSLSLSLSPSLFLSKLHMIPWCRVCQLQALDSISRPYIGVAHTNTALG